MRGSMVVFQGKGIGEEICMGRLFFAKRDNTVSDRVVQAPNEEYKRFERACGKAATQLHKLSEEAKTVAGAEAAAIFEMQELLLADEQFIKGVREYIDSNKVGAVAAVKCVGEQLAERLRSLPDAYMRERATDILDVSGLVIQMLGEVNPQAMVMPGMENEGGGKLPALVVAEDLLPGQVLGFTPKQVAGLVLQKGSELSHAVILAKGMGIPILLNVGEEVSEEYDEAVAVLDSGAGVLYIEPDEILLENVKERQGAADAYRKELVAFRDKETVTKDGKNIRLYANAGNLKQVKEAFANGAEGIGLFRSEQLILEGDCTLDEEVQFAVYRQILESMNGREVVIRTFDIGADKPFNFLDLQKEANPALGLRGIRLCLQRPELLKTQLRALYRAGVYGKLSLMYPMINSVQEVLRLREIECQVKEELAADGIAFEANLPVGIMIETPAAALVSDELAEMVDFFSVGTNDLTQYTLATDRQNSEVAEFGNPHHKAVLMLLQMTVDNGHKAGIPVSICGELAADLSMTKELVRMDFDKLSVPSQDILQIRKYICNLNVLEE